MRLFVYFIFFLDDVHDVPINDSTWPFWQSARAMFRVHAQPSPITSSVGQSHHPNIYKNSWNFGNYVGIYQPYINPIIPSSQNLTIHQPKNSWNFGNGDGMIPQIPKIRRILSHEIEPWDSHCCGQANNKPIWRFPYNRGTPSHHPFLDGISLINHPAMGIPQGGKSPFNH